jgi:hypothetical protein
MKTLSRILAICLLVLWAGPVWAITATIGKNTGNTYTGFEDNSLDAYADYQPHNKGTTTTLLSGDGDRNHHALIRVLLTNIPATAIITSASLFLYDLNNSGRSASSLVQVYKVADANGDWVVGTVNNTEQSGSSCWDYKAYDAATPTAWAGSEGCSTAGTDYVNTLLASATVADENTGYEEIPFNADGLAVLQSWFGDATNNGLLLKTQNENNDVFAFTSSEGTDTNRPYLSITYTLPGNDKMFMVF